MSASDSHVRLTRRRVMQVGLAGAVAAPLANLSAEDVIDEKHIKGFVDCHSHIWTRDTKNYPLAKGATLDDLAPPSFTTEELLKVARANGVGRVVLIQHHIFHGWDNSYMTDAARDYPGVFSVVGMVDDTAPRPDAAMRKLLKQRVRGIRITPRIRGKEQWLDGEGMAAMWKCGAETGQAMCCLVDADDLPGVDRMCQRFPDTPVVIDHFARIGVDGNVRSADVARLCKLAKHKNLSVKVSAFYALGRKKPPYDDLAPMIRRLFGAYGAERLMWGSDSPYQIDGENTYKASVTFVKERLDFLSDDDRQHLLRNTAHRIFFA